VPHRHKTPGDRLCSYEHCPLKSMSRFFQVAPRGPLPPYPGWVTSHVHLSTSHPRCPWRSCPQHIITSSASGSHRQCAWQPRALGCNAIHSTLTHSPQRPALPDPHQHINDFVILRSQKCLPKGACIAELMAMHGGQVTEQTNGENCWSPCTFVSTCDHLVGCSSA
jgi:hypothetical protein